MSAFKHCGNCETPGSCYVDDTCWGATRKPADLPQNVSVMPTNGAIGRKLDAPDGPAPTEIPDNVVLLGGITRLPLPVSLVLDGAKKRDLTSVIIIGTDPEGDFFFASSEPDGPSVLWDLELAKHKLIAYGMPKDSDAAD